MRTLIAILRRTRRSFRGTLAMRLLIVIAMAVVTGATAGLLPAIIGHAVGAVSGAEAAPPAGFAGVLARLTPTGGTWIVVGIALIATVFTVGIGVFSSKLGTSLSGDVTAALRIEMMQAVLGASPRDVDRAAQAIACAQPSPPPGMARKPPSGTKPPPGARRPPGTKVPAGAARLAAVKLAVSREASLVADFGVNVFAGLPQSIATILVLGYELIVSDAWLVLVGGGSLFVVSRVLADRASRRVGQARRALQNADSAVFGVLQETLSASEDLRLWGAREQAVREFATVARQCARARAHFATALAISGQIKSVFTAMAPLLIVVAMQLTDRPYNAAEVAKLLLLVPLLMVRLEALDGMRQGLLQRGPIIAVVERLLNLPFAPQRSERAVHIDTAKLAGHVVFDNVSYTPPGAGRTIIDEVSVDVPPGAIVAICGPSGSGKSSLLRLLLRLDDPHGGSIRLDGRDVRDIEPEQLPRLFGVVRQTSRLLSRAVRDNLAMGIAPTPSDPRMNEVLELVHLHELTEPGGLRSLSTEVRHQPPNFSGGEQRRLLLARMLVQDARVWVLDEPEAGLPSGTAEDILATIVEQAAGRTVLVATHAPHLLKSDFNIVLEAGKLVATGGHDQLKESCGPYRALLADALKAEQSPRSEDTAPERGE